MALMHTACESKALVSLALTYEACTRQACAESFRHIQVQRNEQRRGQYNIDRRNPRGPPHVRITTVKGFALARHCCSPARAPCKPRLAESKRAAVT